jgi:hypothetical protein
VRDTVLAGWRTPDLAASKGRVVSTAEMGNEVAQRIRGGG